MKDTGWNFKKTNYLTLYFFNSTQLNALSFIKIPMRISAKVIFKNDDKFCFFWPVLAPLPPCENIKSNILSK